MHTLRTVIHREARSTITLPYDVFCNTNTKHQKVRCDTGYFCPEAIQPSAAHPQGVSNMRTRKAASQWPVAFCVVSSPVCTHTFVSGALCCRQLLSVLRFKAATSADPIYSAAPSQQTTCDARHQADDTRLRGFEGWKTYRKLPP